MSDYIHVLCRSRRPIALSEITDFILEGVYFDTPQFEAMPGDVKSDWQTLTVVYEAGKRPIVLHKSVGDALMHAEIAAMSANLPEGLRRRIAATFQVIAIEINSPMLTEEAWEMLDNLEVYLAREYDGVIFVEGEGFYDAALQKIEPWAGNS